MAALPWLRGMYGGGADEDEFAALYALPAPPPPPPPAPAPQQQAPPPPPPPIQNHRQMEQAAAKAPPQQQQQQKAPPAATPATQQPAPTPPPASSPPQASVPPAMYDPVQARINQVQNAPMNVTSGSSGSNTGKPLNELEALAELFGNNGQMRPDLPPSPEVPVPPTSVPMGRESTLPPDPKPYQPLPAASQPPVPTSSQPPVSMQPPPPPPAAAPPAAAVDNSRAGLPLNELEALGQLFGQDGQLRTDLPAAPAVPAAPTSPTMGREATAPADLPPYTPLPNPEGVAPGPTGSPQPEKPKEKKRIEWESDPLLVDARRQLLEALNKSKGLTLQQKIDALIAFGDDTLASALLGENHPSIEAIRNNRFSTMANLMREAEAAARQTDENLNKQGLFYGGHRTGRVLPELEQEKLAAKAAATRELQLALDSLRNAELVAQEDYEADVRSAEAEAFARALEEALAFGGDAEVPPPSTPSDAANREQAKRDQGVITYTAKSGVGPKAKAAPPEPIVVPYLSHGRGNAKEIKRLLEERRKKALSPNRYRGGGATAMVQ